MSLSKMHQLFLLQVPKGKGFTWLKDPEVNLLRYQQSNPFHYLIMFLLLPLHPQLSLSTIHEPLHDTVIPDAPVYSPPPSNFVQSPPHQETQTTTIPQQITIHQQPPQQSSSPLSLHMANFDYDFEPGFLIPSSTKRPLLQPLAQGCSESPEMILSKWRILSLQLPNPPEPREYDMSVYRIFDRNAPIIPMEPLHILTHCINQVVFPLWDTIENPRKATTQYEKRSRAYRHSSLIAGGGKVTWKQGVDPYEFGNLLNDHDLHLFSTLEIEKYTPIERRRMFPWFTPFQWTKMFEGTNVSVIPDVQCHQLPLKDMHKGKEIKIKRQKRIKQNPVSSIVSHLSVPETIDIMVEMLDSIAAGIEMTESDAAEFWALNLHISSPASSSGLTVEEKEKDCRTVCGKRSIRKVEYSMVNEVYHVVTKGKFIAQYHEEWWPIVEDISSDEDTAIEVEKGSDFKTAK